MTAICQKSAHNKKKNSPKNTDCPASIHIRIKNVTLYFKLAAHEVIFCMMLAHRVCFEEGQID